MTDRASDSEFARQEGKSEHKRFRAIDDGVRIFEKRLVDFNLAPEIAEQLVARSTNFTYSDGKIIFFSGAPGDMVYCVRRGLVALYTPTEDGSRVLSGLQARGICSATQISWANNVRARFGMLTRATIAKSP